MKKERDELTDQIHELMWHYRGSLSRDEAWTVCVEERKRMIKAIEKRIKTVEQSGLPLL
jgi:uncharacterized coiled-coil DUF342 family protein